MTTGSASTLRTARLFCIPASAVVLATTVITVGSVTPGYRPLADAVSRLGSHDEPHAVFIRIGFVAYGLLVLAGAGPLGAHLPGRERVLAVLIGGYGGAAVIAGLAPKDPPRSRHTMVSHVHVDATLVGGAMLIVAMALVARYAPLSADRITATVVGALTTTGVVIFPFMWGSSIYGLIEIALLTMATLWLVVLSVRLLAAAR